MEQTECCVLKLTCINPEVEGFIQLLGDVLAALGDGAVSVKVIKFLLLISPDEVKQSKVVRDSEDEMKIDMKTPARGRACQLPLSPVLG